MMELLAPGLVALLFILYGLSQRERSTGGCAICTDTSKCDGGKDLEALVRESEHGRGSPLP